MSMEVTRAAFTLRDAAQLKGPLQSTRPVLYTHTLCPYAQRVFLTLLLKAPGEFDVVHVDLSNKPSWYRQVNPRGLVPAVSWKGSTLLESLDICRELEQSMPGTSLTPESAAALQSMHAILDQAPEIISAGLDLVAGSTARHWGVGQHPSVQQQQRFEQACTHLVQPLCQVGGPFLTGPHPSLADVALLPFFERFRWCMQLTEGNDLSMLHGGAITAWMDALSVLPACKLASPEPDLIMAALQEHRSLDFFDFVPYTACQLHPALRQYNSGEA